MTNQAINLKQAIALGKTYIEQGNIQEAKELYEMVLTHLPKNKEMKEGLKRIQKLTSQKGFSVLSPAQIENVIKLYSSGKVKEALNAAEKLSHKFPKNPKVYNLLGGAQEKLGQFTAATASLKQAVLIKPDFAEAHFNLGVILIKLGKHDEAIARYRRALVIKPDYFDAIIGLAKALTELGKYEESILAYQQALVINPVHTESHRSLSRIKKHSTNDEHIIQMETLLSDVKTDADKIQLYFALAKAYEDTDEISKSFNALKKGNDLRKKNLNYGLEVDSLNFSKLKKMMSGDMPTYKTSIHENVSSIKPVFIVGMPRSGTTLVEQILASHSKVHGAGELNAMGKAVHEVLLHNDFNQNKTPSLDQVETIRNQYLQKINELEFSELIVTDKLPHNFKWVGLILSAFPDAKIINLNRDPRAICWSIYKQYFPAKDMAYAYDMEDLAGFYNHYLDLMTFWRERYPDKIYDISYEALTENQEEESRKLIEYCGLEWEEQCLSFHKSNRAVKTASLMQVRKKMYQGSSDAWRKYETQLQPLIKGLGF